VDVRRPHPHRVMRAAASRRIVDAMTTPTDPPHLPPADGARGAAAQPTEPRRRPLVWIAVCTVLALAVVGVTIWALSLQSDLDDQRHQTAEAQQQADTASAEVDQITQDVNDALDQAGQAGAAAKEDLQGALADLKDRLGALGDESKPPAEGSGSAEETAPITATATAVENTTPDGR
jgi:hypothetical protein